jgi:hypothetical protein
MLLARQVISLDIDDPANCLRLFRANGWHVVSDVHLGDWGLQMGMIISEMEIGNWKPIEEWGFTPADGHGVPNRYGPSLPGANSSADIAGAVAMLISPFAAGVNGTTVGVDRGTVLAP